MTTQRLPCVTALCLALGAFAPAQAEPPPQADDVTLDEAVNRVRGGDRQVMSARTVDADGRRVHVIRTLNPDGRVQRIEVEAAPPGYPPP